MPGYVRKALIHFQHPPPTKQQDQPYPHSKPNYGAKMQHTQGENHSPALDKVGKKFIQEVCRVFLFLAWAVNGGLLPDLSSLASQQANPTEKTMELCKKIWILWPCRKKQYSHTVQAKWSLQSTTMRCTSLNQKPAAELVVTCSWPAKKKSPSTKEQS
jgi:hypothetical protein